MNKYIFIPLCLFLVVAATVNAHSKDLSSKVSLNEILQLKEMERDRAITRLFYKRYFYSSVHDNYLQATIDSLRQNKVGSATGLAHLAHILILRRKFELDRAEQLLFKAIAWAQKNENNYILYNFYLNLAFIKTDKRDELQAIHSYRLARREASNLGDKILLASTDLGLANVYSNLQLFDQAFVYCNQVSSYCTEDSNSDRNYLFFSYISKAVMFFMTEKADSLQYYTKKANQFNQSNYGAEKELLRLKYFNLIMSGKKQEAIAIMEPFLEANKPSWTTDKLDLARCYFETGHLDKAETHAQSLIAPDPIKIIPSRTKIKAHLLLGKIAQLRGNEKDFLAQQVAALNESEKYNKNITRIADLSSQIRLDQLDSFYQGQRSVYKKERVILMFSLLATALALLVIGIFYHGMRQKRRYEKLLHEGRDRELSFLNSHKTRKHLSNILGLCTLVESTEPSKSDLLLYFDHVSIAATEMDEWLQEVNKRLTSDQQ